MGSSIDYIDLFFGIMCALSSVYLLILGIRRIRGQYTPNVVGTAQFAIIMLIKGKIAAKEFRRKSLSNKRLNLVYGISALIGIPFMFFLTLSFLVTAMGK